jgi:hypothetical protein
MPDTQPLIRNANITEDTAYKVLFWLISEFGRSQLNGKYPHIEFMSEDENEEDLFAYYDEIEGMIFIFDYKINTLEDLVKTVIHEYWHYRYHSMHHYKILSTYLSYSRNPLETDARRAEKKHYKKCLKFLLKEHSIY